uniref:Uncharacterized protein n=1 Tax=viral metagenome TaxID=1070528 RepID=A0A2V0RIG4_9ZZZZ
MATRRAMAEMLKAGVQIGEPFFLPGRAYANLGQSYTVVSANGGQPAFAEGTAVTSGVQCSVQLNNTAIVAVTTSGFEQADQLTLLWGIPGTKYSMKLPLEWNEGTSSHMVNPAYGMLHLRTTVSVKVSLHATVAAPRSTTVAFVAKYPKEVVQ